MGSIANQSRPSLASPYAGPAEWMRTFTTWMQDANKGHLVATGQVTLTAGATTTTVRDARVGVGSHIGFMPLTANAATEAPKLLITGQDAGVFIISHVSSANTNRTYRYCIMG